MSAHPTDAYTLHEAMADGQGPHPFEPRPPIYERRRSAVSKRYNERGRSAYEKVWRWSGGDWRIGRARKDLATRGMGQPAGLKRLSFMLRVKGSVVKRYYRVCDSSMIQAGWDFSQDTSWT